jgi:nucleoside-diphosphate-sugar epimerase
MGIKIDSAAVRTMQLITGRMGFMGMHTARALLDVGEECVLATHSGTVREPDFPWGEMESAFLSKDSTCRTWTPCVR